MIVRCARRILFKPAVCLALLLVGAPLAPTTARADWFRVSADDVAAARERARALDGWVLDLYLLRAP